MDITFFNTLGREKQVFKPIIPGKTGLYTCGPTVYDYQHIGNFRTFLFEDILKRVLLYNGYDVTHIMNITDVGHLVSDGDTGEDKMEKGSARTGMTVWEIAEYYTKFFVEDAKLLNILPPARYTKATEYIQEQIDLIKCLDDKGYAYVTGDGVYFDTSKLNDYGKLARLDIEGLEEGTRIEFSGEKKNKTDFALWKFSPKDTKRQMEWDSPWGKGFPGWHAECSAMSKKFLGDTFDIHCGGIDHIPVHHTNEIAQSETCNGKPFVHYWLHGAFLEEESGKMSKSKGEFLRLQLLIDKGYSPMDYRYLCLGTHYRKRLLFSWDILKGAQAGYKSLKNDILRMKRELKPATNWNSDHKQHLDKYIKGFHESINDDLNMSEALAWARGVIKDEFLDDEEKLNVLYDFDRVFGLNLMDLKEDPIVDKVILTPEKEELINKRKEAKEQKNYQEADNIRKALAESGVQIIDKKEGVEIQEDFSKSSSKVKEIFKNKEIVENVKEFQYLLNTNGINIKKGSTLDEACLNVIDMWYKYTDPSIRENLNDIRDYYSEILGLNDLMYKVLRVKNHHNFNTLLHHLNILNNGPFAQNAFSKANEQSANRIFELLIATICMSFSSEVTLSPENQKSQNPDIIFNYNNQRIAIECKTLHTTTIETIKDQTVHAIEQILSSKPNKGIVIINLKNIIDHNQMWPIKNLEEAKKGDEIIYYCFKNLAKPTELLLNYGNEIRMKLLKLYEYNIKDLLSIFKDHRLIPGIVLFLQTGTCFSIENKPVPSSFGIFHFINLSSNINTLKTEDLILLNKLNTSMHNG